ncbi:MAG: protein translocase subunit SecD, partial [Desulfobacterales bacterium]|nr:protein translocase subunit SecD [Desulfobacterales bacterium]
MKNFSWKLILVFAVIVAAIIYVLPTFKPGLWPYKQVNLGLDLQGGMHLVLEVDTVKAIEGQVERISQEIFEQLKKKRIRNVSLDRINGTKIAATVHNPESLDKFNELLKEDFDFLKRSSQTESGVTTLIIELLREESDQVEK